MKKFHYHITILCIMLSTSLHAEIILHGKVVEKSSNQPIAHATIWIAEQVLWASTNHEGVFAIPHVQDGPITLNIKCLGYVDYMIKFNHIKDIPPALTIYLEVDNLQLDEVTVTAQKKDNELSTSYLIEKKAINHLQSSALSDIMAQLPGAATRPTQDLTKEKRIAIRAETGDMDNANFGTAIEIDGIRLSNNGNFEIGSYDNGRQIRGIAINPIATSPIASIEITSGLPSVEYGDLTSGLVSIKTKKGYSPLEMSLTSKPKIKAFSLQKGFDIKPYGGIINVAFDHTRSVENRSSPYENYLRNNINFSYQKECSLFKKPLIINTTLAGNIGGYNTESDPDMFSNTYTKISDHHIRSSVKFNYLINQAWIKNVVLHASSNYSNKQREEKSTFDSSSSTALIRNPQTGYAIGVPFELIPQAKIVVVPRTKADSSYYMTRYIDNQPVDYKLALKTQWFHRIGTCNWHLKLGANYSLSGNYGQGEHYADMRYTRIDYRPYPYHSLPFIHNMAWYAENKISFPLLKRDFQVQIGLRRDDTRIHNSAYGPVNSYSPRANMRYVIREDKDASIQHISLYAGIGDAVKLPSMNILFPRESYSDHLVFSDQSDQNNTSYPAYYTYTASAKYNPNLKYQRIRKAEIGLNVNSTIGKLALTLYRDKTFNPYKVNRIYTPYTYLETDNSALDHVNIAPENRVYSIDHQSGIISISDASQPGQTLTLDGQTKTTYQKRPFFTNASDGIIKQGLEWIFTFNKIKALNTSLRIDGAFTYYKGIDQSLNQARYMGNGNDEMPYKYIAYFAGDNTLFNGTIRKRINNNLTLITHIPQSRLVITLRLEASLYHYQQRLSEQQHGTRSYVIDNKNDHLASASAKDIYTSDHYVATVPLYYTAYDAPDTKVPFYDQLVWASEHDRDLYNDLVKLIKKSTNTYTFKARRYSPYFSANFNITKEINDHIALSFLANNFFNNLASITNSQNNRQESLYNSRFIPQFYYGLSLRITL